MSNNTEATGRTAHSDSLTEHVLRALGPHMNPNWIEIKRSQLHDASRVRVLEWIAFSLDSENRAIVAESLELDVEDIEALGRVLDQTRSV